MHLRVPRLYDSHTHFLATGEFASGLNLGALSSPKDLKTLSLSNPSFFRGEWLLGFGWNDADWTTAPHKKILDELFPDTPVFFAKADGHRSWVNSKALSLLKMESDNGVLIEKEHLSAWDLLPPPTETQLKGQILKACSTFNQAGFTHVRDMSCNEHLWNCLVRLSESRELTLAIEENFTIHRLDELNEAIQFCLHAKRSENFQLRMKGIKIFYDGSLGSETAFLSAPYFGIGGGKCGQPLWLINDVIEALKITWSAGLDFSVHCIGDEAAHQIIEAARKVSAQGSLGRLNIEHAQILRPETIQMMKPLHVRCHMQPCHWLSDRVWLKEKLSSLYKFAFPWEPLRAAKIPLSFGCDSPIEPPSFLRNKLAMELSPTEDIKKFKGDWIPHHSHPDEKFADSYTLFEDGKVSKVVFCGEEVDLKRE